MTEPPPTQIATILLTALVASFVASFVAVCFTEPIKAWLQRRRVRRWLYREMIHNCLSLRNWVQSARSHVEMQDHTGAQFASEYKRLADDLAVKDAAFYSLPHDEPYRIDKIYRDFDLVAHGSFENIHDCFVRAEATAPAVLLAVKDRSLSKRVTFSVSTKRQRKYFRENLPRIPYINFDDPPSLHESLYRRCDALQYWLWRRCKLFLKG
jgi:hypothetical protein